MATSPRIAQKALASKRKTIIDIRKCSKPAERDYVERDSRLKRNADLGVEASKVLEADPDTLNLDEMPAAHDLVGITKQRVKGI